MADQDDDAAEDGRCARALAGFTGTAILRLFEFYAAECGCPVCGQNARIYQLAIDLREARDRRTDDDDGVARIHETGDSESVTTQRREG